MENIHIEPTNNTPLITCDTATNTITIQGESRPENVRAFYANVFKWIDDYEKSLFYLSSLSTTEKKNYTEFKTGLF